MMRIPTARKRRIVSSQNVRRIYIYLLPNYLGVGFLREEPLTETQERNRIVLVLGKCILRVSKLHSTSSSSHPFHLLHDDSYAVVSLAGFS